MLGMKLCPCSCGTPGLECPRTSFTIETEVTEFAGPFAENDTTFGDDHEWIKTNSHAGPASRFVLRAPVGAGQQYQDTIASTACTEWAASVPDRAWVGQVHFDFETVEYYPGGANNSFGGPTFLVEPRCLVNGAPADPNGYTVAAANALLSGGNVKCQSWYIFDRSQVGANLYITNPQWLLSMVLAIEVELFPLVVKGKHRIPYTTSGPWSGNSSGVMVWSTCNGASDPANGVSLSAGIGNGLDLTRVRVVIPAGFGIPILQFYSVPTTFTGLNAAACTPLEYIQNGFVIAGRHPNAPTAINLN